MKTNNIYEYSLLRLIFNNIPIWAQRLGLWHFVINDKEIKRKYRRLRYEKELGSHIAHPYDKHCEEKEAKIADNFSELVKSYDPNWEGTH